MRTLWLGILPRTIIIIIPHILKCHSFQCRSNLQSFNGRRCEQCDRDRGNASEYASYKKKVLVKFERVSSVLKVIEGSASMRKHIVYINGFKCTSNISLNSKGIVLRDALTHHAQYGNDLVNALKVHRGTGAAAQFLQCFLFHYKKAPKRFLESLQCDFCEVMFNNWEGNFTRPKPAKNKNKTIQFEWVECRVGVVILCVMMLLYDFRLDDG